MIWQCKGTDGGRSSVAHAIVIPECFLSVGECVRSLGLWLPARRVTVRARVWREVRVGCREAVAREGHMPDGPVVMMVEGSLV